MDRISITNGIYAFIKKIVRIVKSLHLNVYVSKLKTKTLNKIWKMSSNLGAFRRNLRHQILDEFRGYSSEKIYYELKNPDLPCLFLADLQRFCEKGEIPVGIVPKILAPYRVYSNRISLSKFVSFLSDEVTCKLDENPLSNRVNDAHSQILTVFTDAIRSRRTQGNTCYDERRTENLQLSSMWVFLIKLNPPGSSDKYVRLATLCKLVDYYNLSFSVEEFIDAVFAFFGEKLDKLDFEQFALLMQAFE